MHDIAHFLRPAHLAQLRRHPRRPRGLANDRFVALDLLKNANIAAGGVLPMCQDTGTAIVMGKRGQHVLTARRRRGPIARGVYDAYTRLNLRYSQMAPLTMWDEKNTGTNLPAQIELYADTAPGGRLQVPVHGQGRRLGQQVFLYQETKALLNPTAHAAVPRREAPLARHRGLPAVPPRRSSSAAPRAEFALKTAKFASRALPRRAAHRGLDHRRTASATSSWRSRCSS